MKALDTDMLVRFLVGDDERSVCEAIQKPHPLNWNRINRTGITWRSEIKKL
jgi:predicted nucleic-acid-binding protein